MQKNIPHPKKSGGVSKKVGVGGYQRQKQPVLKSPNMYDVIELLFGFGMSHIRQKKAKEN